MNKMLKIRPWIFIRLSKYDQIDIWLSILFIFLGIQMYQIDGVEHVWYYEPMTKYGITSSMLAFSFLFLGILNLIKLLIEIKPNIIFDLSMKFLMFSFLISMSFATMKYSVFHIVSIFYSMTSFLSFILISKTK